MHFYLPSSVALLKGLWGHNRSRNAFRPHITITRNSLFKTRFIFENIVIHFVYLFFSMCNRGVHKNANMINILGSVLVFWGVIHSNVTKSFSYFSKTPVCLSALNTQLYCNEHNIVVTSIAKRMKS